MSKGWIAVLALVAVLAVAPAPATRPIRSVADVESVYNGRVAAADRTHEQATSDAGVERIRNLQALEDRALKNEDVDQATSLRALIREAEAGQAESRRLSDAKRQAEVVWLQNRLNGTLWHWGGAFIRFEPSGSVQCESWSGLETAWRVIDTRTVLLTITAGRRVDRYAILTFDQTAAKYRGLDFIQVGSALPANVPQGEAADSRKPPMK